MNEVHFEGKKSLSLILNFVIWSEFWLSIWVMTQEVVSARVEARQERAHNKKLVNLLIKLKCGADKEFKKSTSRKQKGSNRLNLVRQ